MAKNSEQAAESGPGGKTEAAKPAKKTVTVATRRQQIDFKRMGLDPAPYGAAAKTQS